MKVVLQRVQEAQVEIAGSLHAKIGLGALLLVGLGQEDTVEQVDYLAGKIAKSRVFADPAGKINCSIQDIQGEFLSISQFTLYANTKKGNRPSFQEALAPQAAERLYQRFNQQLQIYNPQILVQTGVFGADMQIKLVNDGPLTIIYEA
ncbi:D-tyrosyl-tRNA(Tyr) deacylase [Lactobacillus sp. DCY120]|uniref:D-aminoacyl-tRNA deacylase n=1 Tax=Bombilactobacillus apium TaxID=2675299 RepID=A0A850QYT2_9LACO|nr:D-aminoacyl-tRNA deacylase [Bombilactobacillus apium]NVY95853.1 D-tyrosyl-tRNA(Tyr) deacylase [Bombilactobacillus apium]